MSKCGLRCAGELAVRHVGGRGRRGRGGRKRKRREGGLRVRIEVDRKGVRRRQVGEGI